MDEFLHFHIDDVEPQHRNTHKDYEYFVRNLLTTGSNGFEISQYELLPGKSTFPYHYHVKSEEAYYILSGKGILKTPTGNREVCPGDLLFFPANEAGAHKLTNPSDHENLIYLDFDIKHDLDVCIYPDSGKVGIWGKGIDKLYKADQHTDYYQGE